MLNPQSKSDREGAVTLEILNMISTQDDITQRHLADRLGVALGLANSYLKRCVRKGFVKIQQAPANRYLYYVTPQGFAEKSRLTADYLTFSFDFYRSASTDVARMLEQCKFDGAPTVMFAGVSELAEIGSIRAQEAGVELAGIYEETTQCESFLGKQVWHELEQVTRCDACILTSLAPSPSLYKSLIEKFGKDRVYVPNMVVPLIPQLVDTVALNK